MGHVINPVAMRVGWFSNWVDIFYVSLKYYPEYLHSILRLRNYLFFFLKHERWEGFGFFHSHFVILQKYYKLYINIYIYDGQLYSKNIELTNQLYILFNNYRRSVLLKRLLHFRKKSYNRRKKRPGLLDDSYFLFKKASESWTFLRFLLSYSVVLNSFSNPFSDINFDYKNWKKKHPFSKTKTFFKLIRFFNKSKWALFLKLFRSPLNFKITNPLKFFKNKDFFSNFVYVSNMKEKLLKKFKRSVNNFDVAFIIEKYFKFFNRKLPAEEFDKIKGLSFSDLHALLSNVFPEIKISYKNKFINLFFKLYKLIIPFWQKKKLKIITKKKKKKLAKKKEMSFVYKIIYLKPIFKIVKKYLRMELKRYLSSYWSVTFIKKPSLKSMIKSVLFKTPYFEKLNLFHKNYELFFDRSVNHYNYIRDINYNDIKNNIYHIKNPYYYYSLNKFNNVYYYNDNNPWFYRRLFYKSYKYGFMVKYKRSKKVPWFFNISYIRNKKLSVRFFNKKVNILTPSFSLRDIDQMRYVGIYYRRPHFFRSKTFYDHFKLAPWNFYYKKHWKAHYMANLTYSLYQYKNYLYDHLNPFLIHNYKTYRVYSKNLVKRKWLPYVSTSMLNSSVKVDYLSNYLQYINDVRKNIFQPNKSFPLDAYQDFFTLRTESANSRHIGNNASLGELLHDKYYHHNDFSRNYRHDYNIYKKYYNFLLYSFFRIKSKFFLSRTDLFNIILSRDKSPNTDNFYNYRNYLTLYNDNPYINVNYPNIKTRFLKEYLSNLYDSSKPRSYFTNFLHRFFVNKKLKMFSERRYNLFSLQAKLYNIFLYRLNKRKYRALRFLKRSRYPRFYKAYMSKRLKKHATSFYNCVDYFNKFFINAFIDWNGNYSSLRSLKNPYGWRNYWNSFDFWKSSKIVWKRLNYINYINFNFSNVHSNRFNVKCLRYKSRRFFVNRLSFRYNFFKLYKGKLTSFKLSRVAKLRTINNKIFLLKSFILRKKKTLNFFPKNFFFRDLLEKQKLLTARSRKSIKFINKPLSKFINESFNLYSYDFFKILHFKLKLLSKNISYKKRGLLVPFFMKFTKLYANHFIVFLSKLEVSPNFSKNNISILFFNAYMYSIFFCFLDDKLVKYSNKLIRKNYRLKKRLRKKFTKKKIRIIFRKAVVSRSNIKSFPQQFLLPFGRILKNIKKISYWIKVPRNCFYNLYNYFIHHKGIDKKVKIWKFLLKDFMRFLRNSFFLKISKRSKKNTEDQALIYNKRRRLTSLLWKNKKYYKPRDPKYLKYLKSKNKPIFSKSKFSWFFFALFSCLLKREYKNTDKKNMFNSGLSSFLIFMVLIYKITKPFFTFLLKFTGLILGKFFSQPLTITYMLINNNQVTGRFLSRYIALKLKQGYTVWELLSPIKKDLNFVRSLTSRPNSAFFSKHIKILRDNQQVIKKNAGLFVFFLKFFVVFYNKQSSYFYNNILFSWINLDMLFFLLLFNKESDNTNYFFKVSFSLIYFIRRGFFSLLVRYYKELNFTFKKLLKNSDYLVKSGLFFSLFSEYLYDDFFSSFESLCVWDANNNIYNNNKVMFIQNFFFNRFLKHFQYKYSYDILIKYLNLNKRNIRAKNWRNDIIGLLGFKISCSGRFSRRDRASHISFIKGKVPLNTLKSKIDYGFWSVPIKNSAISVKVWMNKGFNFVTYDKKFYL